MKIKTISLFLLAVALVTSSLYAQQSEGRKKTSVSLHVGDQAPQLTYAKWIKGTPIDQFEPGHVYVVEFWATWCGPCRMAMPHLSKLARQYRDKVTFIGYDVQENRNESDDADLYVQKVQRFVDALKSGMDYSVATDVAQQTTWDDWMTAAGLAGIPASFIIDGSGKIVWIGHPFGGLDIVLEELLAGTFDHTASEKVQDKLAKNNKHIDELRSKFLSLIKEQKNQEAVEIGKELIDLSMMGKGIYLVMNYQAMQKIDAKKAHDYILNEMDRFSDDPLTLQEMARNLISMDAAGDRKLATQATLGFLDRSSPYDNHAYSLAAEIYFKAAEIKRAIELQERVVSIVNDQRLVSQKDNVIEKAKEDLAKYKAAL